MFDTFCAEPDKLTWFGQYQCGVATVFGVVGGSAEGVATTAGETAQAVAQNAGQTVQSVAKTVGATAATVANPLNLAGFGFGLGAGPVVAIVGLAVGGGVLVDQLLFGGAGTTALMRRVSTSNAGRRK